MKYTNKYNWPQAFVSAVTNDPYSKGKSDISITGLIAPPRIRVLKKKHKDELVEDVSDRVYSLLGQLMHALLDRANANALSEERFYLDIEGITISGQLDAIYVDGLIQDYKLLSYHEAGRELKADFEQQLNCYAYLVKYGYRYDAVDQKLLPLGHETKKLQDFFIFRDWSKGKAKKDPTIPQQQAMLVDVPLWPEEKTLAFIKERISVHKAANKILPDCTAEERWAIPDKWAVMPKKGAVRSKKNHESEEAAKLHASAIKGAFVEFRPGANNRCDGNYCGVNQFCSQYKELKKRK